VERVRDRLDFLAGRVACVVPEPFEDFRGEGVLMIFRTAATRSGLSPRISAISSGVGTGLLINDGIIELL
jgi:hypothetical protein